MGMACARLPVSTLAALLLFSGCDDGQPTTPESSATAAVAGFTSAHSAGGFCPQVSDAQDLARGYQSALRDVRRICRTGGGAECDAGIVTADAAFGALQFQHQSVILACSSTGPTPEVCDGVDNDGDADVDEDFTGLGEICEAGLGVCRSVGLMLCSADGSGVECDATPGEPSAEICNGFDDDCDGLTDEDGVCG